MSIKEAVEQMKPPRYTTKQVAELVGVSEDTVIRWRKTEFYLPSDYKQFGTVVVPLYSKRDVTAMRKVKGTLRPGRKKSA